MRQKKFKPIGTFQLEDSHRSRDEVREQFTMSERKANMMLSELEELRTALEQAERARKAADSELVEASERVSELQTMNSSLSSAKRKLEGDIGAMASDLDDMNEELRSAEEKAKSSMADAARLAGKRRLRGRAATN